MTAPFTPADCDLRDFPFMPIEGQRLFGSEFHALASDGAWRAGVTLWLKSWHQIPAASLPDDDIALARLAELGRDLKAWKKIKAETLRGWVKCDDGRLYHPVVAEKALEAWLEKLLQRVSSGAGNAKRWGGDFDASTIQADIDNASALLVALAPQSKALTKLSRRQSRRISERRPDVGPDDIPPGSQETVEETGTGNNKEKKEAQDPPPPAEAERSSYAFSGTTVRLNDIDLARWRKTYHGVPDIDAELTAIDAWWQNQPEPKRKAWFHATAGMLNRKHQESLAAAKAASRSGDLELPIA